jgi:hypothetical protein
VIRTTEELREEDVPEELMEAFVDGNKDLTPQRSTVQGNHPTTRRFG